MTNQFKQSMAAPDWAMDDYEWRPTFFPQLRFRQTDAARKLREAPDGVARALHGYCQRLGELEAPRQAVLPMLDVANCEAWYGAYEAALTRALADQPGAHLVVLDRGESRALPFSLLRTDSPSLSLSTLWTLSGHPVQAPACWRCWRRGLGPAR